MAEKKARSAAERQRLRAKKIKDAGLVKGSIIYHPEDRKAVSEYAEELYKKRDIKLDK